MASSTKKTTATTKPTLEIRTTTTSSDTSTTASSDSIKNIEKTVQEKTPGFISSKIIWTLDELESFRTGAFNSKFIFYPLVLIVLFFTFRYIWNKIF